MVAELLITKLPLEICILIKPFLVKLPEVNEYKFSLKALLWLKKYKHINKYYNLNKTMDWASGKDNIEVVKWLHANRTEGCTTNAIN